MCGNEIIPLSSPDLSHQGSHFQITSMDHFRHQSGTIPCSPWSKFYFGFSVDSRIDESHGFLVHSTQWVNPDSSARIADSGYFQAYFPLQSGDFHLLSGIPVHSSRCSFLLCLTVFRTSLFSEFTKLSVDGSFFSDFLDLQAQFLLDRGPITCYVD